MGSFATACYNPLMLPHPLVTMALEVLNAYINNEEIQPAPRVGEIHLEAIGHPLEQHLNDEDVGEDLVGVLQDGTYRLSLFNVDVLKSLEEAWSYVTVILPLDLLHGSVQPDPCLRCPCFPRAWGSLKS